MATQIERRELAFQTLDEVLQDAEQLASGEVRVTGKHTYGQILNHLALSFDISTGRQTPPPPPFLLKLLMPLMRKMVINSKPLKPGVKLPAKGEAFFWPDKDFDVAESLSQLKEAIANYQAEGPIEKHPFFGKMTPEENRQLNLRHAALHLSFVHPE